MSEGDALHDRELVAPAASDPRVPAHWAAAGRRLLWSGLAAAAYFGSAKLGYALDFAGPVAAVVWLPAGVGIAALWLGGLGLWPGLVVGDLLANDYSALPLGSAIGQTCGNLLELVVAVALLRRLVRRGSPLDSSAGVGRMLVALAAGTTISATVGGLSLLLGDVISWDSAAEVWRTWWLGDFSGALLVVPLALAWHGRLELARPKAAYLEDVAILAAVAATSEFGFGSSRPLTYVAFPALIWAALRRGQRGATVAVLVSASFAVWNTTHEIGPFHYESITRSVLAVQLYLIVAAVSTLLLAAVVAERERIARRLASSQASAVRAASGERHRIERNLHDGAQNRLLALLVRVQHRRDPLPRADEVDPFLEYVEAELDGVNLELRSLAHGLHPLVLTTLGLADAVRSLAARSPVPVVLDLPSSPLDPAVEEIAYFTIAETITNAQKHAQASVIWATARGTEGALEVEVRDDGVGGAIETFASGLQGLRERLEALGGTFAIESPIDRGTRIVATIPNPSLG